MEAIDGKVSPMPLGSPRSCSPIPRSCSPFINFMEGEPSFALDSPSRISHFSTFSLCFSPSTVETKRSVQKNVQAVQTAVDLFDAQVGLLDAIEIENALAARRRAAQARAEAADAEMNRIVWTSRPNVFMQERQKNANASKSKLMTAGKRVATMNTATNEGTKDVRYKNESEHRADRGRVTITDRGKAWLQRGSVAADEAAVIAAAEAETADERFARLGLG